jgi:hypothetical protein
MRLVRARFTIRWLMVTIVCFGIGLSFLRFLYYATFGWTVYSAQYSESGFSTLHVGMTCEEVEATIGRPLEKVGWSGSFYPVAGGDECWWYSKSNDDGDYWRKWVIFRNGKVLAIVNQWYID